MGILRASIFILAFVANSSFGMSLSGLCQKTLNHFLENKYKYICISGAAAACYLLNHSTEQSGDAPQCPQMIALQDLIGQPLNLHDICYNAVDSDGNGRCISLEIEDFFKLLRLEDLWESAAIAFKDFCDVGSCCYEIKGRKWDNDSLGFRVSHS